MTQIPPALMEVYLGDLTVINAYMSLSMSVMVYSTAVGLYIDFLPLHLDLSCVCYASFLHCSMRNRVFLLYGQDCACNVISFLAPF